MLALLVPGVYMGAGGTAPAAPVGDLMLLWLA